MVVVVAMLSKMQSTFQQPVLSRYSCWVLRLQDPEFLTSSSAQYACSCVHNAHNLPAQQLSTTVAMNIHTNTMLQATL